MVTTQRPQSPGTSSKPRQRCTLTLRFLAEFLTFAFLQSQDCHVRRRRGPSARPERPPPHRGRPRRRRGNPGCTGRCLTHPLCLAGLSRAVAGLSAVGAASPYLRREVPPPCPRREVPPPCPRREAHPPCPRQEAPPPCPRWEAPPTLPSAGGTLGALLPP